MAIYHSGVSWESYLQQQAFTDQINAKIDDGTSRLLVAQENAHLEGMSMQAAGFDGVSREIGAQRRESAQQARATQEGIDGIRLDLGAGFSGLREDIGGLREDMNRQLSVIGGGLRELNWQMGDLLAQSEALHEQQMALISSGFTKQFAMMAVQIEIARNPTKTEAYERFRDAQDMCRRKLYDKAYASLKKAIETYDADWNFYHLAGVLELGFPGGDLRIVNVGLAEASFLEAARCSATDAILNAADCLVAAAWCQYVGGKFDDALATCREASRMNPKQLEAAFLEAKVLLAMNRCGDGMRAVRTVIAAKPRYAIQASIDPEFQRFLPALNQLIDELRDEKRRHLIKQLNEKFEELNKTSSIVPDLAETQPVARWKQIASGDCSWGLLDYCRYLSAGFKPDADAFGTHISGWLGATLRISTFRKKVGQAVAIKKANYAPFLQWRTRAAHALGEIDRKSAGQTLGEVSEAARNLELLDQDLENVLRRLAAEDATLLEKMRRTTESLRSTERGIANLEAECAEFDKETRKEGLGAALLVGVPGALIGAVVVGLSGTIAGCLLAWGPGWVTGTIVGLLVGGLVGAIFGGIIGVLAGGAWKMLRSRGDDQQIRQNNLPGWYQNRDRERAELLGLENSRKQQYFIEGYPQVFQMKTVEKAAPPATRQRRVDETHEVPLGRKTCRNCKKVSLSQTKHCPSCQSSNWWK